MPLLAGSLLSQLTTRPAVKAAGAGAALGLAVGGVGGTVLAGLSAGLLRGWSRRDAAQGARPDPDRVAVLTGTTDATWRWDGSAWRLPLRARLVRQGSGLTPWRRLVWLSSSQRPPGSRCLRVTGALRPGRRFLNPGAPGAGPYRLRVKSPRFVESCGDAAWLRWSRRARQEADRRLRALPVGSRAVALFRALVLGDAAALPEDLRRGLRRVGLSHLVAVSGLHVGLLLAVAWLAAAPLPGAWRWLPPAAAAVLYLVLVGPRPALLRSSAMAALALLALRFGRRPRGLHSLLLVAAALAFVEPALTLDLGFQLTTTATLGILLSHRWLAKGWDLPRGIREPLAASTAAQLASLPSALPAFHLLTPLAPLWNLVAVPWTAIWLAAGLLWGALMLVAPRAAQGVLPALELLTAPYFALRWIPPSRLGVWPMALTHGQAALLAGACALVLRRPRSWMLIALGTCALGWCARGSNAPGAPELVMLDVGQGEAILLRDGERAVLVDGGGWRQGEIGGRVLLPALARLGVRRLEAAVLTHPDLDHCRGLTEIGLYLPVEEIWTSPGWRRSRCAAQLVALPGATLRPLWRGRTVTVGRWRLRAIHPPPGDRSSGNDRSLVLRAEVGERCVLLTGDLEAAGEARLLRSPRAAGGLRCQVLKVAHHGSRSSTTTPFLRQVQPRLALISAGRDNPYGHPARPVLDRLAAAGVAVLRTDRSGALRLVFRERHTEIRFPAPAGG